MQQRSIKIIFIMLIVGALIGTLIGEMLGWILPEGVVKDFFLTSVHFDLGGLVGNEDGVITLNLIIIEILFGLKLFFNFTSLIGLVTAYYFLRYFR